MKMPTPTVHPLTRIADRWGGVPAILAILGCIAFAFSIARWNPDSVRSRYRAIAQEALDRGDYQTALVASQRLLDFGGASRNDSLFKLALANLGLGHTAEAESILQLVAPPEKPVFAPAHLYVARTLLSRTGRSPEEDKAIAAQLGQALTLQPDSPEANGLLFELIEISRRLRDEAGVARWRKKALEYYGRRVEGEVAPSDKDRIFFAEALFQTRDFEKAETVLRNSAGGSNDGTTKRRLALIREAWAADLATNDPDNMTLRAKVIGDGLEQFPKDASLAAALLELGIGFRGAAPAEDTPPILFARGIHAWKSGDHDLAQKLFFSACQRGQTSAALAGELALAAASGKQPDPGLATSLIGSAEAAIPGDDRIRVIRERITGRTDGGATIAPTR